MKPILEPMARPAMITPSITEWGSCSKMRRSLQVPGSLSSPLTSTYFGFADCLGTNDHFIPVGKPAPPRPRRFEAFISAMMPSAPSSIALRADLYPSSSRYLSMSVAPLPKRYEITLTSSGWETRYAMAFSGCLDGQFAAGPIVGEDFVHRVRGQVFVKVVVDLNGGSPAAGSNALYFFQRKKLVRRGFFVANAQLLLAVCQQLIAATQHATDIGAYLYMILAQRLGMEQGVVAENVMHIELRDPNAGGHFADHGIREITDLVLGIEEHGNERGSTQRVKRHHAIKARGQGGTKNGLDLGAHSFILR